VGKIGPAGVMAVIVGGEVVAIDLATGRMRLTGLDQSVMPILAEIRSFVHESELIRTLERRFGEVLTREAIVGIVADLREAGILCTREEVFERVAAAAASLPPERKREPMAFMAIPTGKSWREIEAVVESTVAELGTDGPPLLVAFQNELPADAPRDTPVSTVNRESFREWVGPILDRYGREKRELLERAFALDEQKGWRTGGNRNRLLLMGAGSRFVSGDDDQPSRFVRFSDPAAEIV